MCGGGGGGVVVHIQYSGDVFFTFLFHRGERVSLPIFLKDQISNKQSGLPFVGNVRKGVLTHNPASKSANA